MKIHAHESHPDFNRHALTAKVFLGGVERKNIIFADEEGRHATLYRLDDNGKYMFDKDGNAKTEDFWGHVRIEMPPEDELPSCVQLVFNPENSFGGATCFIAGFETVAEPPSLHPDREDAYSEYEWASLMDAMAHAETMRQLMMKELWSKPVGAAAAWPFPTQARTASSEHDIGAAAAWPFPTSNNPLCKELLDGTGAKLKSVAQHALDDFVSMFTIRQARKRVTVASNSYVASFLSDRHMNEESFSFTDRHGVKSTMRVVGLERDFRDFTVNATIMESGQQHRHELQLVETPPLMRVEDL